ncbi:hypothetical protein [Rhodophyticola sp.]|jgi:hypothetical protein|uniref:hypothetical protein n=1 Tax=Rhodophyticola sp. TaxID=2680032 RepID=UPI003D2D312C
MSHRLIILASALSVLAGFAHAQGAVSDRALDLLMTPTPEPMITYALIGRLTAIMPGDVADIEISDSGEITDVFIRLEPEAAAEYASWTEVGTGFEMTISICGMRVLESIIDAPVSSGTIYIPDLNAIQAEALRALWAGRQTCSTLPHEVFPLAQ